MDISKQFAPNARWFMKQDETIFFNIGFRTKETAKEWIESQRREIDWQVGFVFRYKGSNTDISIVDKHGNLPKNI